ncbi:MAG: 4Fe-4S binding protein [Deltaproteobacteria bacterium]|nr:4Fe-4S binding protein [Deltaproteobacteria bacterium]
MPTDVYQRLARHLDRLPAGFPATETGVELRILRRLFTEDEAELALALTVIPEEPRVVARRAGLAPDEAARRLEALARRGLAFSLGRPGQKARYTASQFVIGLWEYHVNALDEDLIRDVNEYIPRFFDAEVWRRAPQLRTVPVHRSIAVDNAVLPHEQAEQIVRSQKRILVAPCICRREHRLAGHGCDRPEEACLIFGAAAAYYERNGLGRVIDADEAVDILRRADEAGLVLQPSNAQNPVNICCCCGCCCQVLKNLGRHRRPADVVSSAFTAALDAEACVGCGVCEDRCQMAALTVADGAARLDPARCIGCGLCVSTCPAEALTLVRKPEARQPRVPRTVTDAALELGRARGTLTPARLAWIGLRSKLDRLLARR